MITREKLKFLRKHFGKNITPINPNTKKPTAVYQGNHYPDGKKKYEWGNKWTDEQLLSADYLGVYHREDKDKNKPVTIKNNDGLVLIKQSAYMAALTKGEN